MFLLFSESIRTDSVQLLTQQHSQLVTSDLCSNNFGISFKTYIFHHIPQFSTILTPSFFQACDVLTAVFLSLVAKIYLGDSVSNESVHSHSINACNYTRELL